MTKDETTVYYGQRMLNPYPGVLNAVEIPGADALTRDGIEWILYLHGETVPGDHPVGDEASFRTPDIKLGTWSANGGLRRAPVRSVVDSAALEARGRRLLDTIRQLAPKVPFPLRDHYELWLLDKDSGRPLALLDSRCTPPDRLREEPNWRAGVRCKREFSSSRLSGLEQQPDPGAPASHGERLEVLVNGTAGPRPVAEWFERLPDGSGRSLGGNNLPTQREDRRLAATCFPELLLTTRWRDPAAKALSTDFTCWQAPWLLQLQTLSPETRDRLEDAACCRPRLTSTTYRLFPEISNPARLKSALVEARLREVNEPPQAPREEEQLSTFYIEL